MAKAPPPRDVVRSLEQDLAAAAERDTVVRDTVARGALVCDAAECIPSLLCSNKRSPQKETGAPPQGLAPVFLYS